VDARTELLELHGADEGEDQSDEEADQRDDRQRARAGALDQDEEVAALVAGATDQEARERDRDLADEREELRRVAPERDRPVPDPLEDALPFAGRARLALLRNGVGELEEPAEPGGKAAEIERDLPLLGELAHTLDE